MGKSVPLVLSAAGGGILGFSAAALLLDGAVPVGAASSTRLALRASPGADERSRDERSRDERSRAAQPVSPRAAGNGSRRGARADAGAALAAGEHAARAQELRVLRARERVAREELAAARRRIEQLEAAQGEGGPLPAGPQRDRPEFDLTPEDWREMAAQKVVKYRLPCDAPPNDEVLDRLGLAPDDREVMRQAFENSATRLRNAVIPLCAAALGDRLEAAQEMSTEACRGVVLSTAGERSDSPALSARNVASFMAGDAPRPGDDAPLSERLFLILAEEPERIKAELAEAFGPEEAHRIIFSSQLCFRTATHSYGARPNAGLPR